MYNPIGDLTQLSQMAPDLKEQLVHTAMSLALTISKFCRDSSDKKEKLPADIEDQVKTWRQLLLQAQERVAGLKGLSAEVHLAIIQVAEAVARPNKSLK